MARCSQARAICQSLRTESDGACTVMVALRRYRLDGGTLPARCALWLTEASVAEENHACFTPFALC